MSWLSSKPCLVHSSGAFIPVLFGIGGCGFLNHSEGGRDVMIKTWGASLAQKWKKVPVVAGRIGKGGQGRACLQELSRSGSRIAEEVSDDDETKCRKHAAAAFEQAAAAILAT